eukprot:TRINITY_DN55333_c0_g1_i2.p2 TRINITY_DN55333_c0_g1~~TRINITY_DN55333_c0_g1_i2.p2  ORF type:complete len:114 (+),score=27.96 TRINITY_DN55333_c0_g1_i2:140-481(+)
MCIRDRLYGTLVERAAVWERVLGGLCLAASIAFCALHVVAGALSLSKVKKQDAVNTIEEVEKQVLEENNTNLSLIHISEPTRLLSISYAVFCLKKKNNIQCHWYKCHCTESDK